VNFQPHQLKLIGMECHSHTQFCAIGLNEEVFDFLLMLDSAHVILSNANAHSSDLYTLAAHLYKVNPC
jgi:hypothetical protein